MNKSFFEKIQTLHSSFISSVIMIAVTLVTFGIAFIPKPSSGLLAKNFMEGQAKLFNFYDSAYQRLGHQAGLLILVLAVFTGIVIKWRQGKWLMPSNSGLKLVKRAKLYAGGLFLLVSASTIIINHGHSGIIRAAGSLVVFPFLLVILCIKLRQIIPRYYLVLVSWTGNISYILALAIPAFFTVLRIRPEELAWVQIHYGLVLSFADRLAIDSKYFAQWLPKYGLMLPSLLGAYQKHFGLLNFGQHIRIIQAFQVIFVLVAFFAFYLWKPKRPAYILFALMFFGVYISTVHQSIFYPNQSGWRFLGFPLWILCLILVKDMSFMPLSFILGCASGIFLLFNLETGIVITLSSLVFLVSRIKFILWRKILSGIVTFDIGAILLILFFGIIFFMEFGRFPFSVNLLNNFENMKLFLNGFGGLRLEFDPLVIFIFMHCVYITASVIIAWSQREIGSVLSVKLAVASAVLVWFAYYMNRAATWNLWTIFFLYGFLLVDFLDFRLMSFLWRKRGLLSLIDLRVAAFACVLLPNLLFANKLPPVLHDLKNSLKAQTNAGFLQVSGVWLPADIVPALESRVAFAKTIFGRGKTIFLTRDTLIISLMTGQCNLLDVQDVYLEYFEPAKFEYLIRNLRAVNSEYILVDEPSSVLSATDIASAYRLKFYDRIMGALSDRYKKAGTESDWIIWERTAN